jgi:alanine racemase
MPRPLVAAIDVGALRANLAIAKRHVPHAKVWAVVKADAYGHGLERGMRGFADADGLALVEPDGAVMLRERGWQKRILLLEGFFDMDDLDLAGRHRIDVTVHCAEQIAMLECARLDAPVHVHLKMNSGMNRLGITPADYRDAWMRLHSLSTVSGITLMTHFANAEGGADAGLPFDRQLACFRQASADLPGERSIANSATELMHAEAPTDWVRPGIMLYGATPGAQPAAAFGLQPAMTLTSEIIGIQHIQSGDTVGYGSRFVADKPMTVGVVACGYADGYPRHAPDGTPIVIDGIRTRIVGRVSMDMMTVDLSPMPQARIGSKVLLWGAGLPIDEVAEAAGTIGYELMCALAPRVRRVEI